MRRTRNVSVARFEKAGKTERSGGEDVKTSRTAGKQQADLLPEATGRLPGPVDRVERQLREGRRALQTGEAALAEVEDSLGRMEELARQALRGGAAERRALSAELDRLRGEIGRMAEEGVRAGLFQDGDGPDGLTDALLSALEAQVTGAESLPGWLTRAMAGSAPDRALLLAALGADGTASGAELLAALGSLSLEEDSPAAGYLAGLYLGAVISGGAPSGEIDPEQAAQGLKELLALVSEGMPPDEAVALLTGGVFTSIEEFEAQFIQGIAPGLEAFLTGLLLTGGEEELASLAGLLAGGGEGDVDLLMDLLMALEPSGDTPGLPPDAADALRPGGGAAARTNAANEAAAQPWETARFGPVLAAGRALSGVSYAPARGELTVGGPADLLLRGQGQEVAGIRLTGSGTVTIQGLSAALTVEAAQGRLDAQGGNRLAQLLLGEGSTLNLGGGGLTQIEALRGGAGSALRLTGGAVVLSGEYTSGWPALVVDGPASLLAAEGAVVRNAQGQRLTPLDILWKTALPGWSTVTSLEVDGRLARLFLTAEDHPDPLRLWLLRGNEHQGFPAHSIVLRGRDRAGNLRVRYSYVRWSQRSRAFEEITMYPNPFTVTGGEEGTDWRYEEGTQTLRILSARVTAVSGGAGTDGDELPFSGRLALADGMDKVELTLEGVECRVSNGRAFSLGRGNRVALLLKAGSENVFESGPGFAGISLDRGTSLTIDKAKGAPGEPEGKLTAIGGEGGAGIGRDKGAGRIRCGLILIRGGQVTAAGGSGGAGIGGGLGGDAGDIRVQGGTVSAEAEGAAAIGAGVRGGCGDVTVTGSARVSETKQIGGCLFGSCGRVQLPLGAEPAGSRGGQVLSVQVGETTLTLPRLRVSTRTLRLDGVDLSTRETAQAALEVLSAGRRWVGRVQRAYGTMYGQLFQGSGLFSARRRMGVVREDSIAEQLLRDARQTLRLDPLAPYRLRALENPGALLR